MTLNNPMQPYTDAEADARIAIHDAIADAHHAKYSDGDAVSAMGAKGPGNPLHHDLYALSTKLIVGTRVMTAASGDVGYTGVGFTPKAVMALAAIQNGLCVSWGLCDGTPTYRAVGYESATPNYQAGSYLLDLWTSGSDRQAAIVKTLDVDGFTLTWAKTNTPTGTAQLYFLCFR